MIARTQDARAPLETGNPVAGAAESLARRARDLHAASLAELPVARLCGKHVALLCEEPSRPDALLAYRAAIELGAQVSLVRPAVDPGDAATMVGTARMFGRLYDLVACIEVAPALVVALRAVAGVPVLDHAQVDGMPTPAAPAAAPNAVDTERRLSAWRAAMLGGLA